MKPFTAILTFSALLLLMGCGASNPYMVKGSKEYTKLTTKFIGPWSVRSFKPGNRSVNLIGPQFGKGILDLKFSDDLGDEYRAGTLRLWASKDYLQKRIQEWTKENTDLTVTEYLLVSDVQWKLLEDGRTLMVIVIDPSLKIKGSGQGYAGFAASETARFAASKSAQNIEGGTLFGSVVSAVAKDVTNTSELFFEFGGSFSMVIRDKGKRIDLCRQGNVRDLKSCGESMILVKK